MKVRNGFVSNSSSSSFIITNRSDHVMTLVDFVNENPHLVEEFCEYYDWNSITQEEMMRSAIENNFTWEPGEARECVFGDEDGTVVGKVFDYILRSGGTSQNFEWHFYESLR